MSASTAPTADSQTPSTGPANRHALTAVERQRAQLDRLLKDPAKPAFVPAAPKEKSVRPAREMMKNVQGSSAGAGSGEFHVYKASRRREYERLKLLDETSQKELETAEFERKRKEAEDLAEAKTAKNRAKRQKKKGKGKGKGPAEGVDDDSRRAANTSDVPIKKRRLVNGKELVFRIPGENSDGDEDGVEGGTDNAMPEDEDESLPPVEAPKVIDEPRITIHEDD
ncbi:hypothetical protein HWV62_14414 [Athelia sp. TMB]|nr:hypothetical protein HWV62_14414 [Athelia sp. TMB]